jgi:cytoskeletal protein CcmA (bactofilin family)
MAKSSSISSKTVIRGRIVAEGPLEIHGHVEGHIEAQSDVTIGDGALIKSDVQGQRVVVSGAVAGNVRGAELVLLESGARVVGDLSAPSVGIRPGALVRGHVAAGEEGGARPARARTEARKPEIRKPAAPSSRGSVKQTPPSARGSVKPTPPSARGSVKQTPPPAKASTRGKKAPPAPVIPRASGQAKKTAAKKRAEAPARSMSGSGKPTPPVVPRGAAKRRTTAKRRSR